MSAHVPPRPPRLNGILRDGASSRSDDESQGAFGLLFGPRDNFRPVGRITLTNSRAAPARRDERRLETILGRH